MRSGLIGLGGALLLATLVAVVGCGSDDESNDGTTAVSASDCTTEEGGTAVTGLCADAPLNALTDAEVSRLCTDTGAYIAGSITRATGCKYVAIIAAASNSSPTEEELQAACAGSEDSCNQDDTIMGPGGGTLCGQIPATCTATVEQYSACVMDEAVVFEQGASELVSCSMLTFGNLSTAYDVPTAASDAPTCMEIKMACPNFSVPYVN